MVSALLVALAVAGAPPPPAGVLQAGALEVRTGTVSTAARAGAVLPAAGAARTGPNGWAELSLLPSGRLRLSAGTAVSLAGAPERLLLSEGRLWLQRPVRGPALLVVELAGLELEVPIEASVIVEHTRSSGTLVVVRAGRAFVRGHGRRVVVEAGAALRRAPGATTLAQPRAGGRALADLVAEEARDALSDPSGVQAFLLDAAARLGRARRDRSAFEDPLRGAADALGADADTPGALVEEGLRPPPFFEDEVPTKGPNLEVEVRFP